MRRGPLLLVGAAGLFVLEASLLGSFQWYDAYWAAAAATACGCGNGGWLFHLTRAAPWIGAAAVVLATVDAARRGRWEETFFYLAVLGIGLLFGDALKQVFARDRPGIPPWIQSARSFPSGHVFNAALCAGVALRLHGTRYHDRPAPLWVRLALWPAAIVFVAGTAFTRVYLGRHWPSDVVASVLIAVAVFGVAAACRRTRLATRLVATGAALGTVIGLYLLAATGTRIHLSSPGTLPAEPVARAAPRVRDGTGLPDVSGEFSLTYAVHQTRPRLLKLLAHDGLARRGCRHLELLIDGRVVTRQLVRPGWRTYAFPLPPQPAGVYRAELRVVVGPRSRQVTDPQLTVRRMAIV